MQIYQVQQVTVLKKKESPLELVITAQGLAATTGWTNPRLDASGDPNPSDAVLDLSFEADRPHGISLQVLTPIAATAVLQPTNGADAVVVSSRTNRITVHASEFQAVPSGHSMTTFAVGEEVLPSTLPFGEDQFTTFKFGEEGLTTLRFGEETPWTDPRVDDPVGVLSTGPIGEDPGPLRRPIIDPLGPFGRF